MDTTRMFKIFVRAVDAGAEKVLLLAVGVVPDMRQQVGRGFDLRALRLDAAAGELDRREDQRGLRVAHALELR